MKHLTTTLAIVLFMALLGGCNGEKQAPPVAPEVKLEASPTALSFIINGETKAFNITAIGEWEVTTTEKWVTVSKATGSGNATLQVTTIANDEPKTRTAKVRVKQGQYLVEIAISQLGTQPDILVDESTRIINNLAGELIIEVTSNVEYDIQIKEDWLKAIQSKAMVKYTHKFTYNENKSNTKRSATITIKQKDGSITRTILVQQMVANIPIYTLENFKKQTVYGTYISEVFTFAFNEYTHQQSINTVRKSQRIQTFNQDSLSSVTFSVAPSALDQEIEITYDNTINAVSKKGVSKTKVVKIEGDKAWLWSENDTAGFIVNTSK